MKKIAIWFFMFMMMVVLVACSAKQETTNDTQTEENVDSQQVTETKYPVTLTDASGTDVVIKKAPERIVSIAPAETEVLFALGLGDKIVGVTEWCDYPVEAKSKSKVGDMNSNLEAILALDPDLIVGGYTLNTEAVKKLRDLNKTVFTVEPKNIEQVMDRILQMGFITNRQAQSEKLVSNMKDKLAQIQQSISSIKQPDKKSIYLEFDPMWTVGKGEFGHNIIQLAKAINIARDKESWVEVSDEFVIKQNPDVIIYADYNKDQKAGEAIKARNGWSSINAVKGNRVIGIDVNLISRPGPRIVDGVYEIAKGVYPELVK